MPFKTTAYLALLCLLYSCTESPLPTLEIHKKAKLNWETKVPCSIAYTEGEDTVDLPASIKYRGGMSSRYYKHSFSLELDNKRSLAGLPRDDDWVLNANYIDKTFMRHKINYDNFREMSPRNRAPQSTYINLRLDSA